MRDLDFWVDRVESRIREIDPEAVTVVTRDTYEPVDLLVKGSLLSAQPLMCPLLLAYPTQQVFLPLNAFFS